MLDNQDDSWNPNAQDAKKSKGDSKEPGSSPSASPMANPQANPATNKPNSPQSKPKDENHKIKSSLLKVNTKTHSLKPKKKELSEEEKKPILETTGNYVVKSYCRAGLHTYVEHDRHHALKIEKLGLKRFPSENYEDLDFFIKKHTFKFYIVITINDDEPSEVNATLDGIIVNLHTLHRKFEMTSDDIVVVVFANGMKFLDERYKQLLFNDENINKDPCQRQSILAANRLYFHLFITKYNNTVPDIPKEFCSLNVIIAVKEGHHGRKNNIMNFYNGIVYEIATKSSLLKEYDISDRVYSMILNSREVLHKHALYKFLLHFDYYPEAGGLYGDMEVNVKNITCNSIQASQYLENKIDQVYERHFENNFNFCIHDTPTLFCYRVKSILAIGTQNHSFFEVLVDNYTSLVDTNLYEDAEKAINYDLMGMKFEIGLLKYVPDAKCVYEGSPNLPEYLIEKKSHTNATFVNFLNYIFPKELIRSEKTTCQKFLYISLIGYWCFIYLVKFFALAVSYNFTYIMLSFTFVKYPKVEGWLMGYYALIIFFMLVLSLSRNGPYELSKAYHILIFMMIPFTLLALGAFIASLFYLFLWTDGNVKIVPAILIPSAILFGYTLPGALNIKRLCHPISLGVWAYAIYNTTSVNLIPIYSYCNVDDFETEQNCPNEEIRLERKNLFNFGKLKTIVLYFFLNGIIMFLIVQEHLSDTLKLKYVEYTTHFIAWFMLIKGVFAAIDFWVFNCKVRTERKKFKPVIKRHVQDQYEEHCKELKELDIDYRYRFNSFNPHGYPEDTEKANKFANPNNIPEPISLRGNQGGGIGDKSDISNVGKPSLFPDLPGKGNNSNNDQMNTNRGVVINAGSSNEIFNNQSAEDPQDNYNSQGINKNPKDNFIIEENMHDIYLESQEDPNDPNVMKKVHGKGGAYGALISSDKNTMSKSLGINFVASPKNNPYNSEKLTKGRNSDFDQRNKETE